MAITQNNRRKRKDETVQLMDIEAFHSACEKYDKFDKFKREFVSTIPLLFFLFLAREKAEEETWAPFNLPTNSNDKRSCYRGVRSKF